MSLLTLPIDTGVRMCAPDSKLDTKVLWTILKLKNTICQLSIHYLDLSGLSNFLKNSKIANVVHLTKKIDKPERATRAHAENCFRKILLLHGNYIGHKYLGITLNSHRDQSGKRSGTRNRTPWQKDFHGIKNKLRNIYMDYSHQYSISQPRWCQNEKRKIFQQVREIQSKTIVYKYRNKLIETHTRKKVITRNFFSLSKQPLFSKGIDLKDDADPYWIEMLSVPRALMAVKIIKIRWLYP